jgi:hypothetical protein
MGSALTSLALLLLVAPLVSALVSPQAAVADSDLLRELRAGGLVIYFRHAATDWSQSDRVEQPDDWRSCDPARMRQLSDAGRDTARRVGAELRRLHIPVAQVFASELCRCVETAQLLGLGPVETTRDLINETAAAFVGGREALRERARRRLATPPPAGSNTVLVAHGNVFLLAGGDARPVEAGAAILRPDGAGGFAVRALLRPEQWAALDGTD